MSVNVFTILCISLPNVSAIFILSSMDMFSLRCNLHMRSISTDMKILMEALMPSSVNIGGPAFIASCSHNASSTSERIGLMASPMVGLLSIALSLMFHRYV